MMICDECKQAGGVTSLNLVMTGPVCPREILASIDLCKRCQPLFEKKIKTMVRQIRMRKGN